MGGRDPVVATAERVVRAPADVVRTALAGYATTRPAVLPEQYSEFRVDAGGQGAGTWNGGQWHRWLLRTYVRAQGPRPHP
jgi:hypothetical protein